MGVVVVVVLVTLFVLAEDLSAMQLRVAIGEADAVVTHDHRDRVVVAGQLHEDGPAFAVVQGVDQQVPQDPPNPSRVDLDVELLVRHDQLDRGVARRGEPADRVDRAAHDASGVDRLQSEVGDPGIQPADMEQVDQQLREVEQRFGSPMAFDAALVAEGMNRDQYRQMLIDGIRDEQMIQEIMRARLASRARPTIDESEIVAFFEELRSAGVIEIVDKKAVLRDKDGLATLGEGAGPGKS